MKRKILILFILIFLNINCAAEERARVLYDVGILKIWDSYDFKDNRYVTKAEFSTLLNKAFGVDGYDKTILYPHDYIEALGAVEMVINALDYKPMADTKGAVNAAMSYNLTKNVNIEGYLTRKSAVNLIYNMLGCDLMVREGYSSSIKYVKSDKNLFEKLWDVKRIRGTLISADDTRISIDGKTFLTGGIIADDYLYMQVDCYYTSEEERAVYLQPQEYEELIISSSDIISAGAGFIEYEIDDKIRKISFKEIVKNKKKINYTSGIFNTSSTHIRLISSGGSVYDTAFIYEYETYIVDYVKNDVIYPLTKDGANPLGTAFIEAGSNMARVYDKSGSIIEAADLEEGGVIEVVRDSEYCVVKEAGGIIEGVLSEVDDKGIYINGALYKYADDRNFEGIFKIGDELTLYTDIDGKIAFYKRSAPVMYGYLADYIIEEDIDKRILLKIFNHNGELNLHYAHDSLRIDDQRAGDLNLLKNQMVAYKENTKREIIAIYTASEDKNSFLTRDDNNSDSGYTSCLYLWDNNSLTGNNKRFSVGDFTTVFFVSSRNKEESGEDLRYPDIFEIRSWRELSDWNYYNIKIFESDDLNRAKILLVSSPSFLEARHSTMMVVDKLVKADNNENPLKNKIYGYVDGNYSFKEVKTGISCTVKNGDVIEIVVNGKEEIIEKPTVIHSSGKTVTEKQCFSADGYAIGRVSDCDKTGIVISGVYYKLSGNVSYYSYSGNSSKPVSEVRRNQNVVLYVYGNLVTAVMVIE